MSKLPHILMLVLGLILFIFLIIPGLYFSFFYPTTGGAILLSISLGGLLVGIISIIKLRK